MNEPNPTDGAAVPSILIVDDTPANLDLLSTIIRERGYKARPVTSGESRDVTSGVYSR